MAKLIDINIVKAEIERRKKIHQQSYKEFHDERFIIDECEDDRILSFIESLEKEQPDLDAVSYCFDKGINISPRQATAIATHFYSLGQLRSISGPKIKGWAARESDGYIYLFAEKPTRNQKIGGWSGTTLLEFPKGILPQIRWKDEPIEVELIIREVK